MWLVSLSKKSPPSGGQPLSHATATRDLSLAEMPEERRSHLAPLRQRLQLGYPCSAFWLEFRAVLDDVVKNKRVGVWCVAVERPGVTSAQR